MSPETEDEGLLNRNEPKLGRIPIPRKDIVIALSTWMDIDIDIDIDIDLQETTKDGSYRFCLA